MARVALLGFPQDLASQLSRILLSETHTVDRKRYIQDLGKPSKPRVVFLCADTPDFEDTLSALKREEPDLPFVVVTRMPDAIQWLNALDAGAADYCGAPFEAVQVRWVMSSVLRERAQRAAA
jgi:DNA-binding NtrC family response regulator